MDKKIYVTQPSLPPLEEFAPYLEDIWKTKWLTNNGKYHQQLEQELCDYLGVKYCSLFSNATLALIVGLQALRVTGEVITTPFSFVATTHALYWNGIKPVFCDIEARTCNINVDKIESLITPQTTAIMPVHVYGHPCNLDRIEKIADTYGLDVLYDAAHAFKVDLSGKSILNYGNMSILSFHATKVFNTIEGGAIITNDIKLKKRIDFLKNFGFADEVTVVAPGINAKMNELQAAYGLVQLKYIDEQIQNRRKVALLYRELLDDIIGISYFEDIKNVTPNHSYFPILINHKTYGKSRDEVYEYLKLQNIYSRRYFYPLISHFPTYRSLPSSTASNLPIAEQIAEQVLCLPIYASLEKQVVTKITQILREKW